MRLLATGALGDEDWKRAEGFLGELLRLPDSDDGQLRSSAWRDYVACLAQQDEVAREAAAMAAWAQDPVAALSDRARVELLMSATERLANQKDEPAVRAATLRLLALLPDLGPEALALWGRLQAVVRQVSSDLEVLLRGAEMFLEMRSCCLLPTALVKRRPTVGDVAPMDFEGRLKYAVLLSRTPGKVTPALAAFRRLLQEDDGCQMALFGAARMCWRLGQRAEGAGLYEQWLARRQLHHASTDDPGGVAEAKLAVAAWARDRQEWRQANQLEAEALSGEPKTGAPLRLWWETCHRA